MDKRTMKKIMLLITFTILLVLAIIRFQDIWNIVMLVVGVMTPFTIGFIIAFLINMPYMFFSERAFKGLKTKGKFLQATRKPLALTVSYIVVLGAIAFVFVILVPLVTESFNSLISNFSYYMQSFQTFLIENFKRFFNIELTRDNDIFAFFNQLVVQVAGISLSRLITDFLQAFAPSVWDITKSTTITLMNIGLGFVVSIYIMGCKEKLISQLKKIIYVIFHKKTVLRLLEVGDLSYNIFGKFVYGKILDSFIMGVLCFIGMSILGIEYALLISVIIGVTNIIPVFGPIFGAVPSVFILLIVNPLDALWFTIFILILQQIDGNIIGPKILGNSIGISGFWIMSSVIIGSGLFGFVGILLAVPVFSVMYVLLSRIVNTRLKKKRLSLEFEEMPKDDIVKQQMPVDPRINEKKAFSSVKKFKMKVNRKNKKKK